MPLVTMFHKSVLSGLTACLGGQGRGRGLRPSPDIAGVKRLEDYCMMFHALQRLVEVMPKCECLQACRPSHALQRLVEISCKKAGVRRSVNDLTTSRGLSP